MINPARPSATLGWDKTRFPNGIRAVTSAAVGFTWVSEDFLEAQEVRPWGDIPAWIPGDGLMYVDIRRAVDAGLTYRPLATTAGDTLDWDETRPAEERENRRAGMSRERERELLDLWRRRNG